MWRVCENSQPSFGHNIACTYFMDVFWLLLLSQMTNGSANFTAQWVICKVDRQFTVSVSRSCLRSACLTDVHTGGVPRSLT